MRSFGLPQGSVLGPLLFTLYIVPLANDIASFGVEFHRYADDTLLYIAFNQSDMMDKLRDVEQCSKAVHDWFLWNGLALNPDKTKEFLGSAATLRHINCANAVDIVSVDVSLIDLVKSLGMTIDFRLTVDKHVNNKCQASDPFLSYIA